ncbi:MAG: YbaB/EbfC family nucleoid-associated protein [Eubacteriales bacterium]|nr:YbaB/EbfC family nucleoid-associated protein [Eubacteriales bacterium]
MARGGFPMGGNMNNMMKQAQKMQQDMMKMQQELEAKEIEASAGGGAVTVRVTGKKQITAITLSPEVVDPDDIEMLQDLIMVAVNDAINKIEEEASSKMGKLTGGMNIPGLF